MTRRVRLLLALGALSLLLILGVAAARGHRTATIRVSPGADVAAVAQQHPGANLLLTAGNHRGFVLDRTVSIRGLAGSTVDGPVEVRAPAVHLDNLTLQGGGILVREVDGVRIDDVSISGADTFGIKVVDGSADVHGCQVSNLQSAYAMGVAVFNSNSRPRSRVSGCTVNGGQEGIVAHVSRVEFEYNQVSGTTMRGIAVTEMSEGRVSNNTVTDVSGVGIWCGDMSHCEVRDNDIAGVSDAENGARSSRGHGVAAAFHSMIRSADNETSGLAGQPLAMFTDATTTDDFPLKLWPPGWRGALPAVPIGLGAVVGLGMLAIGSRAWLQRRAPTAGRPQSTRRVAIEGWSVAVVVGGFLIQSFHMLEHVVQVWQTFAAQSEVRSGLLGASLDVEWVHLVFNAAVLLFLLQLWRLGRTQGWLPGPGGAAAWTLAAVFLQSYHLTEHIVRVGQATVGGIPQPKGVVGQFVDLTWLHFGVNSAVWVATAVPVVALLRCVAKGARREIPARFAIAAQPVR